MYRFGVVLDIHPSMYRGPKCSVLSGYYEVIECRDLGECASKVIEFVKSHASLGTICRVKIYNLESDSQRNDFCEDIDFDYEELCGSGDEEGSDDDMIL